MDDLRKRLEALSETQKRLLLRRLEARGLEHLLPQSTDVEAIPGDRGSRCADSGTAPRRRMEFSLFFFSADGSSTTTGKYRLLLESAEFADNHGFTAVWTPERHFQVFGGLYPNPSVLGAALAARTNRIRIRAGSVVLPLHHPIRVAEEWSVVDNLSGGRVDVAFASGWHQLDFVLARESRDRRREILRRGLESLEELWSGQVVEFPGVGGEAVAVRLLPRPIQPRLPIWLTTAGNPETWRSAGELGANVLAALIGQSIDDFASKIALYREARREAGHDPETGKVTVMLHTYLGDDDEKVKHRVEAPLRGYLASYLHQKESAYSSSPNRQDHAFDDRERDDMVTFAFEHYFRSSSLLGSPSKCRRLIDRLASCGVDEIACLVDFGLDSDQVIAGLGRLEGLASSYGREVRA